jgi:hypothetical protein
MLFQFSCNAAALNLDLRLWMTAFHDFTLPGVLVVGPRFFDKAPVLQDDIFYTPPWNHLRPLVFLHVRTFNAPLRSKIFRLDAMQVNAAKNAKFRSVRNSLKETAPAFGGAEAVLVGGYPQSKGQKFCRSAERASMWRCRSSPRKSSHRNRKEEPRRKTPQAPLTKKSAMTSWPARILPS